MAGSRFIVIEGLIGVGKTSLCRLLAKERNAELVLEPADDNPFLAQFYADPEHFAFAAQMFYLATRCKQQNNLVQNRLFTDIIVSDYIFEKDRIFAEQTLEGEELELYDRFSSLLDQNVSIPDFVLFLDAPTDVILQRIERRGIEAEQVIQAQYLNDLRHRYYQLWGSYTKAPVYVLNTAELNYIDSPDDQVRIMEMIDGWLLGQPLADAPKPYISEETEQLSLFGHMSP